MSSQTALRKAETSPSVKLARIVLLVGAILAAAAAFGPVWVVRAGVVLAIAAGVIALVQAFRAISQQRTAAADRLLAQTRAHGTALHAERQHNAEVLDVLTARIGETRESLASATADVVRQRAKITALRDELRTEHARSTDLRIELDDLNTQLSRTQERVAEQEAELFVLRAEAEAQSDAEIVGIPRRGRQDELDDDVRASAG